MTQRLATIVVRQLPQKARPALTPAEVDAISGDLPEGLRIIARPGEPVECGLVLGAADLGPWAADLYVWFQAIGAFFLAGFVGEAGRSAWEALSNAVVRILDHEAKQGVQVVMVQHMFLYDGCPAVVRMRTEKTDGSDFSEKELARWYKASAKTARQALVQAKPLLVTVDPESQVLVVDLSGEEAVVLIEEREGMSLEHWKELTKT